MTWRLFGTSMTVSAASDALILWLLWLLRNASSDALVYDHPTKVGCKLHLTLYIMALKVVPELYCSDIDISKRFYQDVLGFETKYERPEEQFAYLTLDGVDLMLEELNGQGRRWLTGEMKKPFGRGINFQWDTTHLEKMYDKIKLMSPKSIFLELEVKSYEVDGKAEIQKQFVVQDPDGYLFRFCEDVD